MEILGRGQEIRKINGVSGSVDGDQKFERHRVYRRSCLTTAGGVCEIVRSVPTERPPVAEPLRS